MDEGLSATFRARRVQPNGRLAGGSLEPPEDRGQDEGENPSSIYDGQDALHEAAPVPHAAEKMAGRGSDRPTGTRNRVPSGARRREPAGDAPRDRRRPLRPDPRENPRG